MKRLAFLPLLALAALSVLICILPGCDELVTRENFHYDTTFIDNTIYEYDTACVLCHKDISDTVTVAVRQWTLSGHASGSLVDVDYQGENSAACGPQCHTNEGFVQSLSGSPQAVLFPTEIGCFTCHAPHTTRDFSLRTTEAVSLAVGSFNRGNSNICAECHRSTLAPPPDGIEVAITPDWGPHFATQADMFIGRGGFQNPDTIYTNSQHTTASTTACIDCHQSAADGFGLGGHSLNLEFAGEQLVEGCNATGCHKDAPVVDIFTVVAGQAQLADSLANLKTLLQTAGILDAEGLPVSISLSSDSAGALYNYLFVTADGSSGSHNLSYARSLVNTALEVMRRTIVE